MKTREFEFVEIALQEPASIGWRHEHLIPGEVRSTLASYLEPENESCRCLSISRTVKPAPFQIARESYLCEDFCELDYQKRQSISTLTEFCDRLEVELSKHGWRLPTEDELEVACGGSLFAWGDEIPEGIPYRDSTEFTGHKDANQYGLRLNSDTYFPEVTRTALKLGDGGDAICGGYEWPIPWLSLCPAFFVPPCILDESLPVFLETLRVRPVKIA